MDLSEDNLTKRVQPGEQVLAEPFERLSTFINRITSEMNAKHSVTYEDLARLKAAVKLIEELSTYAVPPGPELARHELNSGKNFLSKFVSPDEAERAYEAAGEHRRGRPVVRRYATAAALEAKIRDRGLSRMDLAQRFCPCGQVKHNSNCVERLRRDVQRLKALIRNILAEYPA